MKEKSAKSVKNYLITTNKKTITNLIKLSIYPLKRCCQNLIIWDQTKKRKRTDHQLQVFKKIKNLKTQKKKLLKSNLRVKNVKKVTKKVQLVLKVRINLMIYTYFTNTNNHLMTISKIRAICQMTMNISLNFLKLDQTLCEIPIKTTKEKVIKMH